MSHLNNAIHCKISKQKKIETNNFFCRARHCSNKIVAAVELGKFKKGKFLFSPFSILTQKKSQFYPKQLFCIANTRLFLSFTTLFVH